MAKKKAAQASASLKKTRNKIQSSPFKTATELKKASESLRLEVWKRMENALIIAEHFNSERYAKVRKELETGITCNFGNSPGELVKVYSEGVGIKVSLNKELFSELQDPHHAEAVIRAVSDTFSKSYLEIKGLNNSSKTGSDFK